MNPPNFPRAWGRIYAEDGTYIWQVVQPDANGNASYVYITQLIQVLKMSLGESPIYSNYGIPAQRSVMQQIFPDFYVNQTQQQFAPFFAALSITKMPSREPMYQINLTTFQGTVFNATIPV